MGALPFVGRPIEHATVQGGVVGLSLGGDRAVVSAIDTSGEAASHFILGQARTRRRTMTDGASRTLQSGRERTNRCSQPKALSNQASVIL